MMPTLPFFGDVAAVDDLVVVVDLEVGVCGLDPEQGLDHDVVRVVDELLHETSFRRLGVVGGAQRAVADSRSGAPRSTPSTGVASAGVLLSRMKISPATTPARSSAAR